MKRKMTGALCFCNRGFMPGERIRLARGGFKHHTAICEGRVKEAFTTYLHYDWEEID